MNPHRLTFGFAFGLPFAQVVIITILAGLLLTKERNGLPWSRELFLMAALWATFLLSTIWAMQPEEAWKQFDKVSKVLLTTCLTLPLFRDRRKLYWLLMVIAGSLGFYGLKGGVWAVLSGGSNQVLGPEQSFIEGNTNLGLALNMTLPLLFFLRKEAPQKWLRQLLLVSFCFTIIAVLITYSRGALVGMMVVLPLLLLRNRAKFLPLLLAGICIPIAIAVLPAEWTGRMQTIEGYEEDRSALGRIRAWEVSYKLALDRPLLGGGFEPFTHDLYAKYLTTDKLETADVGTGAHNIFMQIVAEHGFTGLGLFVGLILSTLWSLRKIIRNTKNKEDWHDIHHYAQMIQLSLYGYLSSGMFLSMCYFDLFYHLVIITMLLKELAPTRQENSSIAQDGLAALGIHKLERNSVPTMSRGF